QSPSCVSCAPLLSSRCKLTSIHLSFYFLPFFFSYSVPLRDLHSFPTRRSSDLSVLPSHVALFVRDEKEAFHGQENSLECEKLLRSEEHTSELQSRFDLVCRLLLEKKKKLKTINDEKLK